MEKWVNEEHKRRNDPEFGDLYRLAQHPKIKRIIKRQALRAVGAEIELFVRSAYESANAEYMALEETAKRIHEHFELGFLKPRRIFNWVVIGQEQTGKPLLIEVPNTYPTKYRLAETKNQPYHR